MNTMQRSPALAMASLLALAILLALAACATTLPEAQARYTVRNDCRGAPRCFATIQAALDASEGAEPEGWLRVDVAPGDYREKVTLRRSKTRLHGAGANRTFLRFDAVAETAGHYHRDHWGTAGSATLTIDADQVTVEGLTIENTFDYLSNDALADGDPRKIANSQALAVLVDKHSDRVLVQDAALLGYQDTLFADGKRVLVRRSLVAGNVDFIFGGGQLLIADSTLRTRPRAASFKPGEVQSIVAAPSTPLAQAIGIVVYRSRLTREAGVPDGSVALGRPWHPTRNFPDGRYADPAAVGQASYIDCTMDRHIHPDHWTSMLGTAKDGTKTHVFTPQEDARFFESGSRGPGARRTDIGMRWNGALAIAEVERVLLQDWPEARGLP
jgi:pectinesterase